MIRGSSASHSATVSLPDSPAAGGIRFERTATSPASIRNASISERVKPSRRWAKSVRRNSCVWASKSTTTSRPPGAQRARGFLQRPGRIVEEVQHLMDDDEVVAVALDRRRVEVALAQLDVAQARLIDAAARQRQHRRALVDPDRADRARGASSSSIRPVPVPRSRRLRNGLSPIIERSAASTRSSGRVQGADAVPVDRLLGEIGRRLLAARLARDLEPGPVGAQDRVGRIEPARRDRGRKRHPRRRAGRTPRRPRAAVPQDPPRPAASDGATRAAATGPGWRRAR